MLFNGFRGQQDGIFPEAYVNLTLFGGTCNALQELYDYRVGTRVHRVPPYA